ncbi:hypothetical protein MKZ38_000221 [Zalerion maritima]|uniref:Cytochrome c oxidase assembly protein n=1 Tax=Zalerion maritima TaxID=339359 RepID=A0AAD5RSY4_9PEZI|nr:hypothetical protein MKZ38_000221 [Zalerion maritima]
MSRASKLTLLGTSIFATATVVIVHVQQRWEKATMHEGVVRDIEQQRIKRERQADFEAQRELEQTYLKDQSVRDSTGDLADSEGGAKG